MEIISDLTRIAPVPTKRLRGGAPVAPGSSPSVKRFLVPRPAPATSETGVDCHCKRYECFKVVTPHDRKQLIKQFDDIGREGGENAQTMYLSALINRHTIQQGNRQRRGSSRIRCTPKIPDVYFRYKVIVIKDGSPVQVPVCFKAFFSLFGISPARVEAIKLSLAPKSSKSSNGGNEKQPTLSEATRQDLQDFFTVQCGKALAAGRGANEDRKIKALMELFLHDHMGLQIGYETFRKAYQSWAWNATVSRMRSDVEVISDDETEAPATVATRPADSSSEKEVEFKPEMWEEETLADLKREPEAETVVKKEDDPDLVIISDGEEKKEHDQSNKPAQQGSTDKKTGIIACCALACPNTSETFSMYLFPFPTSLRRQWINRIDRFDWLPDKNSALCEIHFDEEMWEPVSGGEQRLKPDAMPTLFLHGEAIKSWVTLDTAANINNGPSNLDAESQDSIDSDEPVEIKQEALEPEIDMVEGQDTMDDEEEDETGGHFETIYCDSTYEGLEETVDDPIGQNEGLVVKDPGQDSYLMASPMQQEGSDRGKIIVLNKDQLNSMKPMYKRRVKSLKQYQCPICEKELSRRKNLELHIQKLHRYVTPEEMEDIVRESCEGRKHGLKKKKINTDSSQKEPKPNKVNGEVPKIGAKVNSEHKLETKAPPPGLMPIVPLAPPPIPTSMSLFPAPRVSAPTFVMAESTAKTNTEEKKQFVLVLQQPPPPTALVPAPALPANLDDVFTISLANVPREKRDTLREKLQELVTAIAVKDLDPHRIIIAYDRT